MDSSQMNQRFTVLVDSPAICCHDQLQEFTDPPEDFGTGYEVNASMLWVFVFVHFVM